MHFQVELCVDHQGDQGFHIDDSEQAEDAPQGQETFNIVLLGNVYKHSYAYLRLGTRITSMNFKMRNILRFSFEISAGLSLLCIRLLVSIIASSTPCTTD